MNISMLPPTNDLAGVFALMALIADPEACRKRLEEIAGAASEVRAGLERVRQEQALLDEAKKQAGTIVDDLKAERARHEASLTAATEQHQAECERREGKLAAGERDLDARERQLTADRQAAAALKTDLERRLAAIKAAAA
jgi:uncharacterized protein (DUF3084 family)